jgi:hypothetical protein
MPKQPSRPQGALVVSLDFELAWGVRDTLDVRGAYRSHLEGAREIVPRLLEVFVRSGVSATWATVGFLFAASREEALHFAPDERPRYVDARLDPYAAIARGEMGDGERAEPLYFAPSLVRQIAGAPGQELASHTYSHLYPMEEGVTAAAIAADFEAARAIAAHHGHDLRSLVIPRHQVRASELPLLAAAGFGAHRGPEPNRLNRPRPGVGGPILVRIGRMLDSYVSLTGANDAAWPQPDRFGLVNVPESRFLRPPSRALRALEPLRVQRIVRAMRHAARSGRICHVWWHPHNMGADPEQSLANLGAILDEFARLRDRYGFVSLSMDDVATRARVDRP